MHDIKWIRDNPDKFEKSLKHRGIDFSISLLLKIDSEYRFYLSELNYLQSEHNKIINSYSKLKNSINHQSTIDDLLQNAENLKKKILLIKSKSLLLKSELKNYLSVLPNILDEDVPKGSSESDNQMIYEWGRIPNFSFIPKQHFEIGLKLGLMDFERASKLSGSRFSILYGDLSLLERAISSFMLDIHIKKFNYREVSVPLLVNEETMFGTGQLPKFYKEQFQTTNGYWLIPTSEVPLTNLVAKDILNQSELPLRFTSYTPCFRSEAGAAKKDTKGMLRQHQFNKVELVSITTQEHSDNELKRMINSAETILKELELPYRLIILCSGELGFSSKKTYDLEVWLPGQNKYREVSSCSNCGDFQSRRMNTRYRSKITNKLEFPHTLNGSGLAVGRTLIAILENYQLEDGSVIIPKVLIPYMNGVKVIKKDKNLNGKI